MPASKKYHHVYVRESERGWDGACEDCDFETDAFEQEPKHALADCLRKHPHPPLVVFAHEHIRPAHSQRADSE